MVTQVEVLASPATATITIDPRVSKDVTASLVYLKRDTRHENEKLYKLHYNPPPGIERQNFEFEPHGPIVIHDLRGRSDLPFEKSGFEALKLGESQMAKKDFYDEAKVKRVYYEELKDALLKRFSAQGAKRVEILEHLVRRRHPSFPKSTGTDYVHEQPTSVVHVDYTLFSAVESSRELLGLPVENFDRVLVVNAWKPLKGPLTDWPLAVCDARTVEESDLVAADFVRRTVFNENYQVCYNEKQEWWYLSEQRSDEIMIFCQAESGESVRGNLGVPHTGFDNILKNEKEDPRESIETRAFIYF